MSETDINQTLERMHARLGKRHMATRHGWSSRQELRALLAHIETLRTELQRKEEYEQGYKEECQAEVTEALRELTEARQEIERKDAELQLESGTRKALEGVVNRQCGTIRTLGEERDLLIGLNEKLRIDIRAVLFPATCLACDEGHEGDVCTCSDVVSAVENLRRAYRAEEADRDDAEEESDD